jgi:lysophospholipase L1-like esterase
MSRRQTVLACLVTTSLITFLTLVTATPAHASSTYADTDYLALGDSYSAGVGAPGQSGLCLVGTNGYPAQWARKNDPNSYRNVACIGATTTDVRTFQVPYLSSHTDLVTVTIGGNDVGFAPIAATCTIGTYNTCAAALTVARDYTESAMPARLDTTYQAIRRKAPNAQIVVLSYPILFDTASENCGIGGMSLAKRQIINVAVEDLDDLIAERAKAAGVTFTDARPIFAGHGICSSSSWINPVTVIPPTNSFHPNQNGYTYGYLPAMSSALD